MRLFRWFTGWVSVRVSGAEPERFLSALAERGIPFWHAAPPEDYTLEVKLPSRFAGRVIPLAESLGCRGELLTRRGLPELLRRGGRRKILAAGLLLAVGLLAISRLFIWDITISGCEKLSQREVRETLAECGVDIGCSWLNLNQDALRNSMILRLPELRWITVTIRGSHAEVILREARRGGEPEPVEEPGKIVAEKAGLVTEVYDLRGTAVIEENRVALPGETLIGGYTTGRFGVQGAVRAIGEVWARTWYERTAVAPVTVDVTAHGGEMARFSLILGKIRINFYKGSSICPGDCDKIIYVYPFAVEDVFALPIALEKTVFSPYERESIRAEELRGELEYQLMEELMRDIGEDGEILSSAFTASEQDGLLYVTLRAECREEIGCTVPLGEAELMDIQSKIPETEEADT